MKKEDMFEAPEDIAPDSVKMAKESTAHQKPVWRKWVAIVVCAAVIMGAFWGVPALKEKDHDAAYQFPGIKSVVAAYPDPVASTLSAQSFMGSDAYGEWQNTYRKLITKSQDLQTGMYDYYAALMEQLLVSDDNNTVCSPINTYIAFAMLAEVSDGNTREQILDMLGVEDIETLRNNISALWASNYVDTPVLKSVLANSLWLNDNIKYNEDTLGKLAECYYASTFSGTPGSEEMNQALRSWTDDNTGGLLTEYTQNMSIDPGTVLEILSTIYFKASWCEEFLEDLTTKETFHGTTGDTTVDMMHKNERHSIYRADDFTALGLELNDSGAVYFLLPDENVDVNTLVSDRDIMRAIQYDENDKNWSYPEVRMSVPKFKVSSKVDLMKAVEALGITDALNPALADFTPLTTDRNDLYLSKAEHAAMVEIDEHGVIGAAYTDLGMKCTALPPDDVIDFVLDRPFMFVVTGGDGSILFAGIVRNIDSL